MRKIKKRKEYKYTYRGIEYFVEYTGIAHIDKYSHDMNKSHIDKVLNTKHNATANAKECMEEFFKLLK